MYPELPCFDDLTTLDHLDPLCRQAAANRDLRHGSRAHHDRSCLHGDDAGIHRVVMMGVRNQQGIECFDLALNSVGANNQGLQYIHETFWDGVNRPSNHSHSILYRVEKIQQKQSHTEHETALIPWQIPWN